jgi:Fe-S-cluster-containing hydrogenase component 2
VLREDPKALFIPLVCIQCQEHPCSEACPEEAIQFDPVLSIYIVDPEKCTACGICVEVCPFRGIFVDGAFAKKCDLCEGNPACAEVCNPQALQWVAIGRTEVREITALRMQMIQELEVIGNE